ncbi:Cyanocobalamin reductase / alkylcobalamin dealkylase [Geodia barretti]|nr:Cyanocobalamin reductase / alkylcobalamin dealkylase [Geodia barretti]
MGLEVHPYKMGWYNAKVEEAFRFPLHHDTLAVLVVSTPAMFEKLFLPFLMEESFTTEKVDPLDACIRAAMKDTSKHFPTEYKVEFVQDSDLLPSRRPRILVQTAGHVSGAAYYYQRTDVDPQPWSQESPMYGVSVHPKYGGWFALRGVLIFNGLLAPGLVEKPPIDCVSSSRDQRIKLLEKFNYSWQDYGYRDVVDGGHVEDRYSERQKRTFQLYRERDLSLCVNGGQEPKMVTSSDIQLSLNSLLTYFNLLSPAVSQIRTVYPLNFL